MMFQNDYFDYKWQRNTPTAAHCFNNTSLADSYVTTVRNSILSSYTEKTAYSEASVPTYQIARCHNVASQVRIIFILKP